MKKMFAAPQFDPDIKEQDEPLTYREHEDMKQSMHESILGKSALHESALGKSALHERS